MKFAGDLIHGTLIKRYKRFLADVTLDSGEVVTAHCPNTGGMLGCQYEGARVWLRYSPSPKRKLAYSWELVAAEEDGHWVGIHSAKANDIVGEALAAQGIPELAQYPAFKREITVGDSRLDFGLMKDNDADDPVALLEVKSVTALGEPGVVMFPDAKTARGKKHLETLMAYKEQGLAVYLFFCVQRNGISGVRTAPEFDPEYARTFELAMSKGVEVIAYNCSVSPQGINLDRRIPIVV